MTILKKVFLMVFIMIAFRVLAYQNPGHDYSIGYLAGVLSVVLLMSIKWKQ